MKEEKFCLECGEPIKGRADKKFCDDQCRSNYNNKINSDVTAEMRNINNTLRKNRKILESVVNDDGKGKISKTKLQEKGFNLKYFTHTYTTQKGTIYKLCYDFGYLPIENDFYIVVKFGKE
jgi:predicted nucleic acid-binding Zn ribbon protein